MLKPTPSRVMWGLLGGFCLILIAAWFSGVTEEICKEPQSGHENCPAYNLAPFILIQIREALHSVEGVITALATIAIAAFTWTLYKSSKNMESIQKISAFVSKKTLEDKFAGRLAVQNLGIYPATKKYPVHITFAFLNGGDAPIEVKHAAINIRIKVVRNGKNYLMPHTLAEPWGISLSPQEDTGINRIRCDYLTNADVRNLRKGVGDAFLIFNVKYSNTLAQYEAGFGFTIDSRNGSFSKIPISQIQTAEKDEGA